MAIEHNSSIVTSSVQKIISKHDAFVAKKTKGLAPEIAKRAAEGRRPKEVERTQILLDLMKMNIPGQQINGRKLVQPDPSLYKKLRKQQKESKMTMQGSISLKDYDTEKK